MNYLTFKNKNNFLTSKIFDLKKIFNLKNLTQLCTSFVLVHINVTSDSRAIEIEIMIYLQDLPRRRQKRRPFLLKKFGTSRREIQTIKFEICCVANDI